MSSIFDAISGALSEAMRQQSAGAQPPQPQMRQPEPEQVQTGRPSSAPASFSDIMTSAGFGNLAGLVQHLSTGGLDQEVKTWLGTGENMPVNSEQMRGALGDEHVQKIGQQAGIPAERILQILAQYLPAAIDRASPNGKLQDPYGSKH